MAQAAFNRRKESLKKKINRELKERIVKTVIWSVALYASETWTLQKEEMRRINALEIWFWRRMEKISWTEKRTDEEVLKPLGEKRRMGEVIVQRKKNWIVHIIRHDGLFKQVIEGSMEGKRGRRRPRMGYCMN